MNKNPPCISNFMTPMPYTITASESLLAAQRLMESYHIRHLPVKAEHKIVGVIALDHVLLLKSHAHLDLANTPCASILRSFHHSFSPATPLALVLQQMAEYKFETALVVQDDGSLIGIFTESDALRALTELLHGTISS